MLACLPACLPASRILQKDRYGVGCKSLKSAERMCRSIEATTTGASEQLGEEEATALKRLLSWPAAYLFPALDISRMLVLSPSNAEDLAKSAGTFELSSPGMMLPDITPRLGLYRLHLLECTQRQLHGNPSHSCRTAHA